MAKETKEVAVVGEYAIMKADPNEVTSIIQDNLGDEETMTVMDLTRVSVPSGGGTTWVIPDIDQPSGELETKEITGVIIATRTTRQYWQEEFDGSGSPPDCSSADGITGVGNPGGLCADCPFNEFGSDLKGGRSKACSEKRLIFIARENDFLPTVVAAPAGSLKNVKNYLVNLASKMRYAHSVYTALTLEKDKNADGIVYSKIVPRKLGDVEKPEVTKAYAHAIKPFLFQAAGKIAKEAE